MDVLAGGSNSTIFFFASFLDGTRKFFPIKVSFLLKGLCLKGMHMCFPYVKMAKNMNVYPYI